MNFVTLQSGFDRILLMVCCVVVIIKRKNNHNSCIYVFLITTNHIGNTKASADNMMKQTNYNNDIVNTKASRYDETNTMDVRTYSLDDIKMSDLVVYGVV